MGEPATDLDRSDLIGAIRTALVGEHPVVTIVGEAGIGKTTVLNAALASVPVDWAWQVQCFEAEAELGLAVLAGLFEAIPVEIVQTLPEPQRQAVDVVLYQASADGPSAVTGRLLGATTLSMLNALLARGSVRLVLDDLHWCDPTSLAALSYALSRSSEPDLSVVTTARTGQVPRLPRADVINVSPLTPDATRRLVRSIAPLARTAQVEAVVESSDGNPFFAGELARALADHRSAEMPGSLRVALGQRLAVLPNATLTALLDLAIRGVGDESEVDIDALDPAMRLPRSASDCPAGGVPQELRESADS